MLVATVLVIASQALATREVIGLHREVATRRFDERLTELVRRSSDMIAICDTDGVIRYASPSSEQLLGATPGELNGQRLDDVLGPEAPHMREAFDQVLRDGAFRADRRVLDSANRRREAFVQDGDRQPAATWIRFAASRSTFATCPMRRASTSSCARWHSMIR